MVTKERQKYYYERWKESRLAKRKIARMRTKLERMLGKPLLLESLKSSIKEKLKILNEMGEGKIFDESIIKKYFTERERQVLRNAGYLHEGS